MTKKDRRGIAVAGSILTDVINTVSRYPASGELTQISSISRAAGGCVPNVAADLKILDCGIDVYACGKIADDENGRFVLRFLEERGVDTGHITVSRGGCTSFTQVVSVAGGQRTFFTYPGASADFGFADVGLETLNVRMLHLGYFLLLEKADNGDGLAILKKAKDLGIETSIDLMTENSDRYSLILPCLPYVDYIIVNETEGARLAGMEPRPENAAAAARKLLSFGVRKKVIIHFPEGSVCASANGILTVLGSRKLPNGFIKGATGAGDAFCAGALLGIYRELSDREVLALATDAAAAALRGNDAVSGLADAGAVKQLCGVFERNEPCLSI